jgi:hypothetical protein
VLAVDADGGKGVDIHDGRLRGRLENPQVSEAT